MISLVTLPGMTVHPGMSPGPWISKTHPVVRWFFVGAIFLGLGLSLLKLFVGVLGWPFWAASLVQAETCTLLRYLANDRWVFHQARPTWARLWKYHVANAGGFAVWWTTANALQRCDVPYLWAATLAVVCSTLLSLATNFLWVWRRERRVPR
jgi:putative flippase GtrA